MNAQHMDDKSIIISCLSGDKEELGLIVRKYQKKLLAMVYGILGDREEARDVTQEALVQVYIHLDHFDQTKNFRNWLFSIAYKRCLDRIRGRKTWTKAMKELQKSGDNHSFHIQEESPFENTGVLKKILSLLNSKERTALTLKILSGYSCTEIGEIIGCSGNTVRVHVFNAKRKIKKLLEENFHV